jgi:hypothetical protein
MFFDPNRETMYAEMDGRIYERGLHRNKGREWRFGEEWHIA